VTFLTFPPQLESVFRQHGSGRAETRFRQGRGRLRLRSQSEEPLQAAEADPRAARRSHPGEAAPAALLDTLTSRELEVLRLIGRGTGRLKIGKALSRAPMTIDEHQSNLLQKLGLTNRAELMRFAIREGLVEA